MHSNTRFIFIALLPFLIFSTDNYSAKRAHIVSKYMTYKPTRWGMNIPGVKTHIKTEKKVIALTFDACGGKKGSLYDKDLISFLISEKIPATLFITTSWASVNEENLIELRNNTLFELENHGFNHRPASVRGAYAWHIRGTVSPGDCFDEVEKSAEEFERRIGHRPRFYRAGTAYYDNVALEIIRETGQIPMNFTCVAADADRRIKIGRVERFMRKGIREGAVFIMHFNHPGGKTLPALKTIIPEMRASGYTFVRLSDMAEYIE